jgi:hypothetical protein
MSTTELTSMLTPMSTPTLLFDDAEPHKGSQATLKPSKSTSCAQSMPTQEPNPSKGNDITAPTLSACRLKMTKTPPMLTETEPSLSKSSLLSLHACLSMIKYALYSNVPNMDIRILESNVLVTKANSIKIHAQLDEQEPPTLKALPMHSDTPRLTHHSNARDACLKRIVDMELPNSINIVITEIQAPSNNVKLAMIVQTVE